ncbi:uncharacterized protein TrAFT101_004081 [Trichoderma asperellum]|uniref:uncharacterized protein n=1 Tax=Trichoderma asperellum TaxID=101201 RepID=UPI0033323A33|nr:hypothetical protein TrAFT101_004081 [Trichoderma asperellum]
MRNTNWLKKCLMPKAVKKKKKQPSLRLRELHYHDKMPSFPKRFGPEKALTSLATREPQTKNLPHQNPPKRFMPPPPHTNKFGITRSDFWLAFCITSSPNKKRKSDAGDIAKLQVAYRGRDPKKGP